MKRFILVFGLLLYFLSHLAHALDVPELQGYVNDYAGMISDSAKAELINELRSFEQTDSTQLVILTIPSLRGEAIEDFSIKVGDSWKIGQKGKDNGIIFLVSKEERKMRIEVGRGLEGRLTDLTAGRISDLVIKPRFKRGDFDGGFLSGISSLIDATRGEFKADVPPRAQKHENSSRFITFLIFGTILILFLGSISRVLGSIAGGLGLPVIVYLAISSIGLVTIIILAIAGVILGIFLPILFSSGRGSSPGGGYFGTGGGGFGGFGSDSGGGGFSGGGGGFGGGGSSGDW